MNAPADDSQLPARSWGMPPGKSAILAGVLQIVIPVGAGRFYLGDYVIGAAQLATAFVGVGLMWSMLDGVALIFGAGPRRR